MVKSFDDLPIPFRCIATDLVSRSMHVFKDGSLSHALRSTMSIPGFFIPVKDEGKVYVDYMLFQLNQRVQAVLSCTRPRFVHSKAVYKTPF